MKTSRAGVMVVLALVCSMLAVAAPAGPGPAPPFSLELFNGQNLRLADLQGTAVILLFWAPW